MPASGGEEEKVLDLSESQWGNWSLASKGVYFVEDRDTSTPYLAFFDFSKKASSKITQLKNVPENPSLTLSPDAKWLLFSRLDKYEGDIMIFEGNTADKNNGNRNGENP